MGVEPVLQRYFASGVPRPHLRTSLDKSLHTREVGNGLRQWVADLGIGLPSDHTYSVCVQDKTTARASGPGALGELDGVDPSERVTVTSAQGTKHFVVVESGTVIGRAFPADIVVDDPRVSKQHLRVWLTAEGTVRFADLGSTNGTLLNHLAVSHGAFAHGDRLVVGSVQLQLQPRVTRTHTPGVLGFESFVQRFAEEQRKHLLSAQPFSLLVVESQTAVPLSDWAPRVLSTLGAHDRAALLRQDALVVLVTNAQRSEVRSIASALAQGDGGLRVGSATYPVHGRDVSALVSHAIGTHAEQLALAQRDSTPDGVVRGRSTEALWALVERAAPSAVPVMIFGESGTGKELFAQALHQRSARGDKPLRAVNCGAIPANLVESTLFGAERGAFTGADRTLKGLFEQAHQGTLFLDEVGELALSAQASLLRVLETGRVTRIGGDREIAVDVRVVSATHRELEKRCENGEFRWDLFYRLNGLSMVLPPLRERTDEIEPLALRFLQSAIESASLSTPTLARAIDPRALAALRSYPWPGNIRELRNCIQRAALVANGPVILLTDLTDRVRGADSQRASSAPPEARHSQPPQGAVSELTEGDGLRKALERHETKLITEALAKSHGSTSAAAALLQIPIRTLTHKMNALGIKKRSE
ncbi:MAG: sigma 54-interacting transcriptional regulator [Deltaproteobacteria bacterium]|nr:sigma 54-interacting transcriptional regulator [Deltaproteobacteria bacterium]